jgi:hypothetical protein
MTSIQYNIFTYGEKNSNYTGKQPSLPITISNMENGINIIWYLLCKIDAIISDNNISNNIYDKIDILLSEPIDHNNRFIEYTIYNLENIYEGKFDGFCETQNVTFINNYSDFIEYLSNYILNDTPYYIVFPCKLPGLSGTNSFGLKISKLNQMFDNSTAINNLEINTLKHNNVLRNIISYQYKDINLLRETINYHHNDYIKYKQTDFDLLYSYIKSQQTEIGTIKFNIKSQYEDNIKYQQTDFDLLYSYIKSLQTDFDSLKSEVKTDLIYIESLKDDINNQHIAYDSLKSINYIQNKKIYYLKNNLNIMFNYILIFFSYLILCFVVSL